MMKNVNLQIEVEIKPEVIWRLKLFMAIMRFAVWVGGFGGVDFEIPERHLTQRVPDECHEAVCEHKFASVTNTLEVCVLCGIRR